MSTLLDNRQNQSIAQISENLTKYCPDFKVRPGADQIVLTKGLQKTTIEKVNNAYTVKTTNVMVFVYVASLIVIILCIGWLMGKRKDDLFFMLPSIIGIVSLLILIYNTLSDSKSINHRVATMMKS